MCHLNDFTNIHAGIKHHQIGLCMVITCQNEASSAVLLNVASYQVYAPMHSQPFHCDSLDLGSLSSVSTLAKKNAQRNSQITGERWPNLKGMMSMSVLWTRPVCKWPSRSWMKTLRIDWALSRHSGNGSSVSLTSNALQVGKLYTWNATIHYNFRFLRFVVGHNLTSPACWGGLSCLALVPNISVICLQSSEDAC